MSYERMTTMHVHENRHRFHGYAFTYHPDSGYYQITCMMIAYFFPDAIAEKLVKWHQSKGSPSAVRADEFFETLPDYEKKDCARFDINTNSYL